MKRIRTKDVQNNVPSSRTIATLQRIEALQRFLPSEVSRASLSYRLGEQYQGVRKIYQALGYPKEDELVFSYFYNKWDRQDVANAVINKPVDLTWSGDLNIAKIGEVEEDSMLSVEWKKLDKELKVKKELGRIDALDGIGRYSLLLFGFNDVKNKAGFARPAGTSLKLNYLRSISEGNSKVLEWETDSSNKRFGQPKYYEIEAGQASENGGISFTTNLKVHHSRILHIASGSLVSNVYGISRLKPIVNRLEDLEKLLGGDAETFWRGARPGFHVKADPEYTMTSAEDDELDEELDKYEHDLRRFIRAQGVDLKSLEQQVSDPLNHVDIQIQAISAQTGMPKRILVGSERGELSSTQDKDQWLTLITNRREKYAEPDVFRAFIDKCMEHGILTKTEYIVIWSDLFAPSEKEKAEVGKIRADAAKAYFTEPLATEMFPIELFGKFMLGLNKEQLEELMQKANEAALEEDASMNGIEEDELIDRMVKQINQNNNRPKVLRIRTRSNGQS